MGVSKNDLLICAESAAKYINEHGSGGFISLIIDMLEISRERYEDENEQMQNFLEIIYNIKDTNLRKIIGGGGTLNKSFKMFVEDFLQIEKLEDKFVINNKQFKNLRLKEIHYVLAWTRRLVKNTKKSKGTNIQQSRSSNNKSSKRKKYKNDYSPFNNKFAMLKDYLKQ
ncbi:hypothetical protein [Caloranaerobacter sp. DY30410]|uniref:hypothetical protein n=1 Tax=Caloranaerobacter sp. DY30410 TaxID=3238305 RepID=UPI003D0667BE